MENKNSLQEVDFTAVTYESVLQLVPFKKYWKAYVIFAVVALISVFVLLLGVFVLFIGVAYFGTIIDRERRKQIKIFAKDNDWRLYNESIVDVPIGIKWSGHSHKSSNVISGRLSGSEMALYDHAYTIGGGKNKSIYSITVINLKLNSGYPYMLLDSKNNRGGAREVPKSSEKLSLEGNFDDYFQLYVEPDYRIDVLSVITPDVMLSAMNSSSNYDIEIYRDNLWLYVEGDKRNKTYIKDLFKASFNILDELNHRSKSFNVSSEYNQLTKKDMNQSAIDLFKDDVTHIEVKSRLGQALLFLLLIAVGVMFTLFFGLAL